MKIIGGSFGTSGRARIKGQLLQLAGARSENYHGKQIVSVDTRVERERRFGFFGFLLGSVLLAAVGFMVFHLVGAIIGIVLAVAGSFYTQKRQIAEVRLDDESRVELECTSGEIRKLMDVAAYSS